MQTLPSFPLIQEIIVWHFPPIYSELFGINLPSFLRSSARRQPAGNTSGGTSSYRFHEATEQRYRFHKAIAQRALMRAVRSLCGNGDALIVTTVSMSANAFITKTIDTVIVNVYKIGIVMTECIHSLQESCFKSHGWSKWHFFFEKNYTRLYVRPSSIPCSHAVTLRSQVCLFLGSKLVSEVTVTCKNVNEQH